MTHKPRQHHTVTKTTTYCGKHLLGRLRVRGRVTFGGEAHRADAHVVWGARGSEGALAPSGRAPLRHNEEIAGKMGKLPGLARSFSIC